MKITALIYINILIPAWIWNHGLFLFINGLHNPVADKIMGLISGFGDGLVAVVLIFTLMLFRFRLALAALLAFSISGIIAQILKRIFDMPRPPTVFGDVHILGESLAFHSFPSGHATTCGVLALLSIYVWRKQKVLRYFIFSFFILIALGRVYGGVHFPLDVTVGFAIGGLCMWFFNQLSQPWKIDSWRFTPWSLKVTSLLILITSATLAFNYHIQPATATVLTIIAPMIAMLGLFQAWREELNHGY